MGEIAPQIIGLLSGGLGAAVVGWWLRRKQQAALDYSQVAARAWERLEALEEEVQRLRSEIVSRDQTIAAQALQIQVLTREVEALRFRVRESAD